MAVTPAATATPPPSLPARFSLNVAAVTLRRPAATLIAPPVVSAKLSVNVEAGLSTMTVPPTLPIAPPAPASASLSRDVLPLTVVLAFIPLMMAPPPEAAVAWR